MSRPINSSDDYMSRLLKNIPSEIVGVYIAASGIPVAQNSTWILWVIFALCLVATPFWLIFKQQVRSWPQIVLTSIAFVIWVMTLGGPFSSLWPEVTMLGSILLILFTGIFAPLISSLIS